MLGEGILSTFSLPRKNNDQEMNCKISRSQPTTKRAKKFIIQNIKIATTPVVPIPFGLQDVVKIATPDSCSPDYKISRTHHQMEQRSNKRAKSSRCQDRTTKRRKKEGNEGNAKDMPGEGILSTFSLPRKNNDQENELQNIKIATNH